VLKVFQIQTMLREGFFCSGVQTKFEPLFFGTFEALKIIKNGLKMRMLLPCKIRGVKNYKK
jgi:hypothetical protein